MPTVRLRDVPPGTVETIKQAAQANGRSMSDQMVHLLNEDAERLRRTQDFLANVKVRTLREPVDVVALIREAREEAEETDP